MDISLQEKSSRMKFLRQIERIVHDDFSVYSLNTKSFYHGLNDSFTRNFEIILTNVLCPINAILSVQLKQHAISMIICIFLMNSVWSRFCNIWLLLFSILMSPIAQYPFKYAANIKGNAASFTILFWKRFKFFSFEFLHILEKKWS